MPAEIWIRKKIVTNTDPFRRCYNGCNFSEKVECTDWKLFQTWKTKEFADLVAKGLRRGDQQVFVKEIV